MYASFWKRATALLIDWAIFSACLYPILLVPASFIKDSGMLGLIILAMMMFLIPIIVITAIIIVSLFDCSDWQGTPGKKILRIKICDIKGNRLGFWRAFIKNILKIFSVMSIIGAGAAAFTKNKQAVHDLICDTLVINSYASVSNLQVSRTPSQIKILMVIALIVLSAIVRSTIISSKRLSPEVASLNAIAEKKARGEHRTELESLDELMSVIADLKKALDEYIAKNGKPKKEYYYDQTFNMLNIGFPGREPLYIKVDNYMVYPRLTNLHHCDYSIDVHGRNGRLHLDGCGKESCGLEDKWCEYLKKQYGFANSASPATPKATPAEVRPKVEANPQKVRTRQESLDEVMKVMADLKKALDEYLSKNGKPDKALGYSQTLDALKIRFPDRESIYIKIDDYRVYAMLTNIVGGYWVHVDKGSKGGILRLEGSGKNTCQLDDSWCEYLKKQHGFTTN